jgi:oxalate decarboxylase
MFSRRDLLAASAMGAAMTVSAANAGSFGNPDEPPEGAINAKNPVSVTDPGPQDPAIRDQLQSAFSPPPTDVGGMPQIWSSFNTVQRRISRGNGGGASERRPDDGPALAGGECAHHA